MIVGHIYDQMSVEVTIPACGGTATVVGSFTDALEGKLGAIGGGQALIGGHLFCNNTLYMTGFLDHGTGNHCYGEAAACNDPSSIYRGQYAYPYAMYA